jgi:hypothetical protein
MKDKIGGVLPAITGAIATVWLSAIAVSDISQRLLPTIISGTAAIVIYNFCRFIKYSGLDNRWALSGQCDASLTKPDPMSIGTDRPMALVQTRRQGLHQDRLTSIVGTSDGSSYWLLAVLTEQPVSNTCRCGLVAASR